MTTSPNPTPEDLHQEATGEGYDPDKVWPDEPVDLPDDIGAVELDVQPVEEI